jgi:hypothetical protein
MSMFNVHVSKSMSQCPSLHVHVSMSPCLCLNVHVSLSMSQCPRVPVHVSISRCFHVYYLCLHLHIHVSMSMTPCFRNSATGNGTHGKRNKRKTATSLCLLQTENGNGKLPFVYCKWKRKTEIYFPCLTNDKR